MKVWGAWNAAHFSCFLLSCLKTTCTLHIIWGSISRLTWWRFFGTWHNNRRWFSGLPRLLVAFRWRTKASLNVSPFDRPRFLHLYCLQISSFALAIRVLEGGICSFLCSKGIISLNTKLFILCHLSLYHLQRYQKIIFLGFLSPFAWGRKKVKEEEVVCFLAYPINQELLSKF